ncbi:polysaccharide pyruvyl transferase family protein [Kocuria palustris]|uniref:glycosyltransferase family protein n=1 Tax=Kocuria palustris TaxID=71999 RepID=UPI00344E056D
MQSIAELKADLESKTFDQGFHWRILFLGRSINGTTDIVSSLSRSLRNLGHHVLDLDLKFHRVAENPERVSGGNGPIYVQAEKLQPVVESFRPQMIICCAGGLTFTGEDAARLKAQGIVLVGITLSDPDVFPTIKGHAHVFDIHTTNAELSLEMYREAGVPNTVYFPFGIDRGFVTQEVEEDPSMEADVICLGHANSRPDRNQTMTALDKRFDVKTYGRGWDIPGSEPVAGDRALQALKMGRIHINFPLTRAGFINIKCGVFESVGAGAVIATGEFEEMAHFFDYGEEIIGYTDDDDLAAKIETLLENPQEYERIRLNGFRRLVENHLYEHRWMDLFDVIRHASPESTPWLDEGRISQVRQILDRSLPRARKVIISGFYGAGNLGDELILRSISSALESADPAVQVTVAAESPRNVELQHGLQAFKRADIYESAHQVHTADAVVVGGGGLWHDLTFHRAGGLASLVNGTGMSVAGFGNLPMMGRVLGVPYHVIGLGAGPLQDRDAQAMVRFLAQQTESILVRDADSQAAIEQTGVDPATISCAPDVVYAVDLPSPDAPAVESTEELRRLRSEGRRLVGVNLRRWAHEDMDAVVSEVEKALNALAAEGSLAVIGIPMQAGAKHDRLILEQLAERLSPNVAFFLLPDPPTFEAFDQCLGELDALLTMRLHAALLAHRRHLPTIGLVYDPKVQRHFDEVRRSECALPLTAGWERILDGLQAAVQERRIEAPATLEALTTLEAESRAALEAASARVAAAPARPAVYEIPSERPAPTTAISASPQKPVAAFTKATFSATGLEIPERALNVLFDSPRALHISLPTTAPTAGQEISNACSLHLDSSAPTEVSLSITSNYERAQNAGKISLIVQIGDFLFEDDLARSKTPVMLRVRTSGVQELPVRVTLRVNGRCYPAQSWPKYSRVSVRIHEAHAIEDRAPARTMFASAGQITQLEAQPSEDQQVPSAAETR